MKKIIRFSIVQASILAFMFVLVGSMPGNAIAQKGLVKDEHINIFNELATGFACLCGCGSTIKTCPHKKCGFATPLKKELTQMILNNVPKEKIIEYFVAKHGERLLSAPPKRGWYLVGYFLPAGLIIFFGLIIKKLVTKWASIPREQEEGFKDSEELSDEDEEYSKRLKNELEDFETK